ncbi:metal-dependent transcriptional regulator [Candidatus Micrarchaeota archaeon]|nr:metal-dependent transcriptional regulator [Candidatus Micrarchaeota archaeon]
MLSRTSENYLRVIYEIIERKGYARPKDISTTLDISPPSVTQMLQKLAKQGLVNYEKHGAVTLTEQGKQSASALKSRYQVFLKLFDMAGVSPKTAFMDACYLEHQLSEETLTKLIQFIENIEKTQPK